MRLAPDPIDLGEIVQACEVLGMTLYTISPRDDRYDPFHDCDLEWDGNTEDGRLAFALRDAVREWRDRLAQTGDWSEHESNAINVAADFLGARVEEFTTLAAAQALVGMYRWIGLPLQQDAERDCLDEGEQQKHAYDDHKRSSLRTHGGHVTGGGT